LSYHFIVLILSKRHGIPQVLGSTSSHNLIKDPVILALYVVPVNPLRNYDGFVISNDNGLIEVMLECLVKSIINSSFLLNKSWVFFPLFPYQICFSLVVDFLPLIWILGLPENWSSHVYVGGWENFHHNTGFFLLTISTIISLLNVLIPLPHSHLH
jgi:hypothetical protein